MALTDASEMRPYLSGYTSVKTALAALFCRHSFRRLPRTNTAAKFFVAALRFVRMRVYDVLFTGADQSFVAGAGDEIPVKFSGIGRLSNRLAR